MTDISELEDLLDVPVMDVAAMNRVDELIQTAWDHWDADQALPLDLVVEMAGFGIDVEALERNYQSQQ